MAFLNERFEPINPLPLFTTLVIVLHCIGFVLLLIDQWITTKPVCLVNDQREYHFDND